MAAISNWYEIKAELERETAQILTSCPDEIKRFHYGIITHSDAGKYAKEQYFGHWTHVYAEYYAYSSTELNNLVRWAEDPEFELHHLKKAFTGLSIGALGVAEYGGQKRLGYFATAIIDLFDTSMTKSELAEVLKVYQAFVSRLYWWMHWYFPWGIGPVLCHRLSEEDIREIARLSQTN